MSRVSVEDFCRLETGRMFAALQAQAGGVNQVTHNRVPTPLDQQTVIRMNRDTLYSLGIVDLAQGATVTMPDTGDRYSSVMVIDENHYINEIVHEPGEHRLSIEQHGSRYVGVGLRILADPNDAADVAKANALQDQFTISAPSAVPFAPTDYDADSFEEVRHAVLTLARGITGFDHAFGRKADVDPIRHLMATAAGWAACRSTRRTTSTSIPASPWASTGSPSATSPWTRSGRSRCTTRTVFSSRRTTGW